MDKISRKDFLKTAAITTAATMVPIGTFAGAEVPKKETFPWQTNSNGAFYFVHLTDQHVRSKRKGDEGYRRCIESVNGVRPRPDFALMGGDNAFDGNYTPKEEFAKEIELYKTISDKLNFPYYNSIGNHDILGWSTRSKVPADDPDIGKKMIMDRLEMKKSYYSFDHKGWHFVVLDSIYPIETKNGTSYEPRIGKEQLEWLAYDLGANNGKPIIALTHIAAFYNITTVNGDLEGKAMSPGIVLRDSKDLRLVLERHKVKALLQGHSHITEDYEYNGVWYLTSPAVSAAWWGGNWLGFQPGYTVFHCQGDKLSWERRYYHWDYVLEPEDTLEKSNNEKWEAFQKEQKELAEKENAGIKDKV